MDGLLKRTGSLIKKFFSDGRMLAIWIITTLLIPNAVLPFTEGWSWPDSIAGFLMAGGTYMILTSLIKRVGLTAWFMLPFMILAAFQIVLLNLYGRGLIAVDMFLNVFTTSFSEATILLRNLVGALCLVGLLYVTALVWGAVGMAKHLRLDTGFRRLLRVIGLAAFGIGLAVSAIISIVDPAYDFTLTTFPVNVCDNLLEARLRTRQFAEYGETSRNFTYSAKSMAPADRREIYVVVVGETSRGENWQLGGYGRETNPRLSRQPGLTYFPRAFSESNTTHKSVPLLISAASAQAFDSIYCYKSMITAFKEAGYKTAFFSNQTPNRSYTQFFGDEADVTRYISGNAPGKAALDTELLPLVKAELDKHNTKQFIILHTYGSHFLYSDRYDREQAYFMPDDIPDADAAFRNRIINAYDNSIRYTDLMLSNLIDMLRAENCRASIIYASDHGEDIFDDKRHLFLHASPVPTARQLHVGALCWLSDSLTAVSPHAEANLKSNAQKFVSTQKSLFNTIIELASIQTPYYREDQSLVSPTYTEPVPIYLTDRNEVIPWRDIQFRQPDIDYLNRFARINFLQDEREPADDMPFSSQKKIVNKTITDR